MTTDEGEGETGKLGRGRGCGGAEVEMSASIAKSTTCRYGTPGCRYRDGNKVTKKSCYRSMEHHSRGVSATRHPCKYPSARRLRDHVCATASIRRDTPLEEGTFCSTLPSTEVVPPTTEAKSPSFPSHLLKFTLFARHSRLLSTSYLNGIFSTS